MTNRDELEICKEQQRAIRQLIRDAEVRHRPYEKQVYLRRWQELVRAERAATCRGRARTA